MPANRCENQFFFFFFFFSMKETHFLFFFSFLEFERVVERGLLILLLISTDDLFISLFVHGLSFGREKG